MYKKTFTLPLFFSLLLFSSPLLHGDTPPFPEEETLLPLDDLQANTPSPPPEETTTEFAPSSPEYHPPSHRDPLSITPLLSPLSGQPHLQVDDLIAPGAQPLTLRRLYFPPYIPASFPYHRRNQHEWNHVNLHQHIAYTYHGWQLYPHLYLECNGGQEITLVEPSGTSLHFTLVNNTFTLTSLTGITNTHNETPSGAYDPRNTHITYTPNLITVKTPYGVTRLYRPHQNSLYLLHTEHLANGKVLRYHYDERGSPTLIESLDPSEHHTYASLRLEGSPSSDTVRCTSSSGQEVTYHYHHKKIEGILQEKGRHRHRFKHRRYLSPYSITCPPLLDHVSSPLYRDEAIDYDGFFLLRSYSGLEGPIRFDYTITGSPPHHRVASLSSLIGNTFIPTYSLSYDPPIADTKGGTTTILRSDQTSTVYHFSKELLTTSIQLFHGSTLLKEKRLLWDDHHHLQAIELYDGESTLLSRRSFTYDAFGNPLTESFTGDLTGAGGSETLTIRKTFSKDHLLLREEHENGQVITMTYLPHTHLITSRLTYEGDHLLLRSFSSYDDCHNLIQTTLDDGNNPNPTNLTGVTQRKIITYTLRSTSPYLHLPEWEEEKFWDGSEHLLSRKHFLYDDQGHIAHEEHYDAKGSLLYTLHRTYNERGDLVTETNPLGQESRSTYDPKGHRTSLLSFSHRLLTTSHYDTQGRLIQEEEKGDDLLHRHAWSYDPYDRILSYEDPFHNTTSSTYETPYDQPSSTTFPSLPTLEGAPLKVTTSSRYDALGRESVSTDANGSTTTTHYNAYGYPTEILHPDGTTESFRYTKEGRCASHTTPDGVTVTYRYDVLGRVLVKESLFNNTVIATERFTYNSFHCLCAMDAEGKMTRYTYDGAGRKIKEDDGGRIKEYFYDTQGFLERVRLENGTDPRILSYARDLEGKILEETCSTLQGTILSSTRYAYDHDGHRSQIIHSIGDEESITSFRYDSLGRLIENTDPLGSVTSTSYSTTHNGLGQQVLQTTITDPLTTRTITYDAHLHPMKEVVSDLSGLLTLQEKQYDGVGNLLFQRDENGSSSQTLAYTYTPMNKIASYTRAFGTVAARTTRYTYSMGRRTGEELSDGVTLSYRYDPLGNVTRIDASDHSIHHAFTYNRVGALLSATDEQEKLTIHRKVNGWGDILEERFPHGCTVTKEYDAFSRVTSLNLGSHGKVVYTYDPLYLREVQRLSAPGWWSAPTMLYTHRYEAYDRSGSLLREQMIGALGTIEHRRDLRGSETAVTSPYWREEASYDRMGNRIHSTSQGHEERYRYDSLSQLLSEEGGGKTITYGYDALLNRTRKNGVTYTLNERNELVTATGDLYDPNGNQIVSWTPQGEELHLTYDPLHRLKEIQSSSQKACFTYDPLGRRLKRVLFHKGEDGWKESRCEEMLYDGEHDIGTLREGSLKHLRVLGIDRGGGDPVTVAIEVDGKVYAPLLDIQGNIRELIEVTGGKKVAHYAMSAFGEELSYASKGRVDNPWRFASKRVDEAFGIVSFGKRDYVPSLGRWLTPDPIPLHPNPYPYVLNNPLRYKDPTGELALLVGAALPGATAWWTVPTLTAALTSPVGIAAVVATVVICYAAPEIVNKIDQWMADGVVEQEIEIDAGDGGGSPSADGGPEDPNHKKKKIRARSREEEREKCKRHTPEQSKFHDLIKRLKRKQDHDNSEITNSSANRLIDQAKKTKSPYRDHRKVHKWTPDKNKPGKEHIHVGQNDYHIVVKE